MFEALTMTERCELGHSLASATAECSGRASGAVYTATAAQRAAYRALSDEIRPLRDEVFRNGNGQQVTSGEHWAMGRADALSGARRVVYRDSWTEAEQAAYDAGYAAGEAAQHGTAR